MADRVVVALSGGVDSSVAAALLAEQGYVVVGVMFRLWAEGTQERPNRCCTPEAVARARAVSRKLGIPFEYIDVRDSFREAVVEYFVAEYAAARTPNPCVRCNRDVRFPALLHWAAGRDAKFVATGHYARIRKVDERYQLLRGRDPLKDQSYVLHTLTQRQLGHILFPLGGLLKEEVRAIARERGLAVADQAESQDVCFLADEDYRRFIRQRLPETTRPGPIVNLAGDLLGQHEGLVNYTVGQRKGIGVAASQPLYVLSLDPGRNALIVGPAESLEQEECRVDQMHCISGRVPPEPFSAEAKIRYRHHEVPVVATPLPQDRLHVRFSRPQRGVTPGQYLVLYDGPAVLGGGVICASNRFVLE